MFRTLALLLCSLTVAIAAGPMGTWKLNAAKSKYEGIPAPKDQTVTYTAKGAGYDYLAKGTSSTGAATNSSFTYTKDGEDIKATGFPYWDAISLKNGSGDKSTAQLKRGGKVVGTVSRTISTDGKAMTLTGTLTLPDGKRATYNAVYDKQ
jgi:hypothetical protein